MFFLFFNKVIFTKAKGAIVKTYIFPLKHNFSIERKKMSKNSLPACRARQFY